MKTKRVLPPTKVGRRPRRKVETSQKKDREAIDAAFKRMIGDDGFRPQGAFGRKAVRNLPKQEQDAAASRSRVFEAT
jgi:hypothetical protein